MFHHFAVLFVTTAFFGISNLGAATLHESMMIGQVQQHTNAGAVEACGVTVSAVEVRSGTPAGRVLVFNGSIMIYGLEGGLMKGRAAELDAKLLAAGKADFSKLTVLPTASTWMKAQGKPQTFPRAGTEIRDSDDKGYRIYASDFDSILGVLNAVLQKQAIQVGMKIKGVSTDRILFGTVSLTDGEYGQLVSCMSDWSDTMKRKHKLEVPESNSSGPAK